MNEKEIIKKQYRIMLLLSLMIFTFVLILIGGSMNFIVITENNGKMPVLYSFDYFNKEYFSYQDSSEINYHLLTDRFKIGDTRWSLGDIFMTIGFYGFLILSLFLSIQFFKLYKLQKGINFKVIKTQWKDL